MQEGIFKVRVVMVPRVVPRIVLGPHYFLYFYFCRSAPTPSDSAAHETPA
jgi:hypothetical protein